jgi:hypothetical protein
MAQTYSLSAMQLLSYELSAMNITNESVSCKQQARLNQKVVSMKEVMILTTTFVSNFPDFISI